MQLANKLHVFVLALGIAFVCGIVAIILKIDPPQVPDGVRTWVAFVGGMVGAIILPLLTAESASLRNEIKSLQRSLANPGKPGQVGGD